MSDTNDPLLPQDNRPDRLRDPEDASVPVPIEPDGSPLTANPYAAVRPEILTAPPKPMDLLRSLQRRWLLALVLGLMLGVPAAVVTWFVIPVEYTAESYLQFSQEDQIVVDRREQSNANRKRDIVQTHIQLILSRLVLNAALSHPGIADISWLQEVRADDEDQAAWLKEQLSVVNPRDTAILRISMSGDEAEPVKEIVNAVSNAYLEKVVSQERNETLLKVETLERQHRRLVEEIRQRRAAYKELVDAVGAGDGNSANDERQFQSEKKIGLQDQINVVRTDLMEQRLALKRIELVKENDPQALRDKAIRERLEQNAQYIGLQTVLQRHQDELEDLLKIVKNPNSKAVQKLGAKMQGIQDEIQKLEDTVVAELGEEELEDPVTREIRLRKQNYEVTQGHLNELVGELEEVEEIIRRLTVRTPELQQRKDELDRMEAVSNEVGLRLEKLQLELTINNAKVKLAQPAETPEMYDSSARDRFAIMAALGGLGLAIAGVSLYEFQFRRLSSAHDMTEGLGMRVIGNVPLLTERHWRLPGMNGVNPDSLQSMMDESVDSIRSLILHSASYQSAQVVMVTSANSGEGKTTLSGCLAASLGRSGRRTLLVDGDLRRPAVHRMLDLPLDTGLSEVLRGEASVEEAIRPSRAPGLWVMPAGRCDHESIQSLTKDILGETLEKLRDEFDMIIVDTGPVLSVVDPLLIGQHCDGAIVSVVRRVSQITNVYDTCQRLQNTGIRLFGSVVNGVSGGQISVGYYGYGYGYNDGYGQHEIPEDEPEELAET